MQQSTTHAKPQVTQGQDAAGFKQKTRPFHTEGAQTSDGSVSPAMHLGHSFTQVRTGPRVATAGDAVSAPIQPRLVVGGDQAYRQRVQQHLQNLAADDVNVNVHPETGHVSLEGEAQDDESPSHTLLTRLINHNRTTRIHPLQQDNEAVRTEPEQPRSVGRATLDTLGDIWNWRRWGSTRQLRDRAASADPQRGTNANIYYDANMPEGRRLTSEAGEGGIPELTPAPQHIALAHEMIHAGHFMQGRGAFSNEGHMLEGLYNYLGRRGDPAQEPGRIEEMNAVGLDSAEPMEGNYVAGEVSQLPLYRGPDTRPEVPEAITENQIREQFELSRRVRYP